jgi:RNA polymerase sigma factor (sigma-70 family)
MTARHGAIVDSFERLFADGTVVALDESQLLDRFLALGDESSFEAIVGRHGPMVLGVCRHVLDDQHDVEDAFQATFLILVKKARSIRDRDVLGTWLHGVARRVAVRAQANSRRRQLRERTGLETLEVSEQPRDPVESKEIRRVVHDELERLPYRFRAPLVLCDLEGQTHEGAAAQLSCPVGTIKSRLSRGRARLRERLTRRGLASPLLLHDHEITTRLAVDVPSALLRQATRTATGFLTKGTMATGSAAVKTAWLADGVIRSMTITAPKVATTLLLAGTIAVGGVWLTAGQRTSVGQASILQSDSGKNLANTSDKSQSPAKPETGQVPRDENTPPKRGALRIARLKHAGDWFVAPQALPNLMRTLRQPPLNFDVVINSKDLHARDPSLIYYPLLTIRGRAPFHFSNEDLEILRLHLDPGGGTIFGDAYLGNRDFDASFRKFVTELLPKTTLVPIPKDDDLYRTRIGFDLSNVEFTTAAGRRRGFAQLEGVKINGHWAIIYSKFDISGALDGQPGVDSKGYTPESARKIACNVVIYSTLP